jgi:uncharacterized protein YdeI (YjbR/CyaY-like superfamily)
MRTKGGIEIPGDLAAALERDPNLLAMWERLRPSCQREHVAAVLDAKRPDSRARRVDAVLRDTMDWCTRHPRTIRAPGG